MKKTSIIWVICIILMLSNVYAECSLEDICKLAGFDGPSNFQGISKMTGFHGDEPMIDYAWDSNGSDATGVVILYKDAPTCVGTPLNKSGIGSGYRTLDRVFFCKKSPDLAPVGVAVALLGSGAGVLYVASKQK